MSIKCACGNAGCSTQIITTSNRSSHTVEIVIEHKDRDGEFITTRIALDANSIVQIIQELKSSLQEII